MKIVIISIVTPFRENIRGTSALAYHILKGCSSDIKVTLYTFNSNKLKKEQITEVANELGVMIKVVHLPRWYQWMFRFHLLFLRAFLRYPFVNYIKLPKLIIEEIKTINPDMIWVNSEELSRIVKQFPGVRRMQLGPDVESLYYYRMMGQRFVMNNVVDYWKCAMMYRKYARLERNFCTDGNFTYYAVGEADIEHLQQINPKVNCKFLRHPHYEVKKNREIHFNMPKIKLLVAGRYDLYMQQTADELMEVLTSLPLTHPKKGGNGIRENYKITFLGKGWENPVEKLKRAGYDVKHITFAPNYIDEICKHDIQLTPICIGTGTKGKVLDALANGLLVLGTPYALENIAVEHGKSCVEWHRADEIPGILIDILDNREQYEQMALAGRNTVLEEHNPTRIAKELFQPASSI